MNSKPLPIRLFSGASKVGRCCRPQETAGPASCAKSSRIICGIVLLVSIISNQASINFVTGPDLSRTNSFYISNRRPLLPSQFVPLQVGSVQPKGWLLEMLRRQKEGLTGHLGEISAWLQKEDNAWLSKNGKGKYGWEELPYWLKGYIELSYIFNDPK